MDNTSNTQTSPMFEQWAQAKGKRDAYLTITVVLLALAVIGIVVSLILSEPEPGWVPWVLINFGTYGIGGISAIYMIILIVAGIVTFIHCIRSNLGLIVSAVLGVLAYGLGFMLFVKVVSWLYNLIDTDFIVSFLGITVNGAMEIPVSGTLGGALLNTAIFTLPFIFCVIKLVLYARKVSKLSEM